MAALGDYRYAMHPAAARADYNAAAATYAQESWIIIDSYRNLAELVPLNAKHFVLDVGCGVGHMGVLASRKQGSPDNVYFVDQSQAMIHEAEKNMRLIWKDDKIDALAGEHFINIAITSAATCREVLESAGHKGGFDVVFAKHFIGQYVENARIPVIQTLLSLVKKNGVLVCDIPHLAVSRNIIYPNPNEHTAFGVRTMAIAAPRALPSDLLTLHAEPPYVIKQFDVLLRPQDVASAKDEVRQLVQLLDEGRVLRMDESFWVSGETIFNHHNRTAQNRAIKRTALQEHSRDIRVDVELREWVDKKFRRVLPERSHRAVKIPLSVDVAIERVEPVRLYHTVSLVSVRRVLTREEIDAALNPGKDG